MSHLSPAQNERLREAMKAFREAECDGNTTTLAEKLGRQQPSISDFLNRKGGAAFSTAKAFSKLVSKDVNDILGPEEPQDGEAEPPQPTVASDDTRELHPLDAVLEDPGWVAAAGLSFDQAQAVVAELQDLRTKATVPLPRSAWRDERYRAINRVLGRDAKVHHREPPSPPFDPNAPSPERQAQIAAKKAESNGERPPKAREAQAKGEKRRAKENVETKGKGK